jgi:hypothetical protein
MKKEEAEQMIQENRNLIGQRRKNTYTGKVETVIDIKSIQLGISLMVGQSWLFSFQKVKTIQ